MAGPDASPHGVLTVFGAMLFLVHSSFALNRDADSAKDTTRRLEGRPNMLRQSSTSIVQAILSTLETLDKVNDKVNPKFDSEYLWLEKLWISSSGCLIHDQRHANATCTKDQKADQGGFCVSSVA